MVEFPASYVSLPEWSKMETAERFLKARRSEAPYFIVTGLKPLNKGPALWLFGENLWLGGFAAKLWMLGKKKSSTKQNGPNSVRVRTTTNFGWSENLGTPPGN